MTLGDQPAFPVPIDNNGEALKTPVAWGMTYRQWLVGQIAAANNWDRYEPEDDEIRENHAELIIKRADAIIKRLEEEGK